MGLQFGTPAVLVALALVPAAAWLALRSGRLAGRRRTTSIALRCAVIGLVVVALAGPRIRWPVSARGVAFLVDVSDSVPREEVARTESWISEAMGRMEPSDRAAVVAFGERALVDRTSRPGPFEAVRSMPGGGRTDLGAALRLGLAVLPSDARRRIVVASDGRSNLGDVERQIELASASGVPIDVVPLAAEARADEVLLRSLDAPVNTRAGQRFDLTAVAWSASGSRGRIQIASDEAILHDEVVDLPPGESRVSVAVTVDEPGFHRYTASLSPERDASYENNTVGAHTLVAGAPRLLVIASDPDRAELLMRAIAESGREADLMEPGQAPTQLLALGGYDAAVLVDVPATEISDASMLALEAFVRDLGRGLVMVGGEDGFGAGGYRHTPIERAMPVEMEVRDRETRPDIALAFVIDRSGSMGDGTPGGANKLELAKRAAREAGLLFRPQDATAVIAFDDTAYVVHGLQPHEDGAPFARAVSAILVGGGTNIYAGLEAAVDEIEGASAGIKHVILLSDGWSDASGYDRVLARMDDRRITLSIVAVGQGSAEYLRDLAEQGGGRYYAAERADDVPQIFVEETMTALGTYIVEERFQPIVGSVGDALTGVDLSRLRPLDGYNPTTAKQSAQVELWSHLDDPVLAHWHYGLGRSLAWTSDLKPQWAAPWVGWSGMAAFTMQLVDWTLPAPDDRGFVASATVDGGTVRIGLDAADEAGLAHNLLDVTAVVSGPDGRARPTRLEQAAPGRYEGQVDVAEEGTYLVRLVGSTDGRTVGTQTFGVVVPYSAEYARAFEGSTDSRLFEIAERTGGRVLSDPAAVFADVPPVTAAHPVWPWCLLLAALLFPADVAARKLRVRRSDLAEIAARARRVVPDARPTAGEAGQVYGSLLTARGRARHRGREARAATDAGTAPEAPSVAPHASPPQETRAAGPEGAEEDTLARLRRAKSRARREG